MRIVDVVLDAGDADEHSFRRKACVGEAYETAEAYLRTNVRPVFFCPDAVKLAGEGELGFLVVVKIFYRVSQHIPRCTALGVVVANIRLRQHTAEYRVCVVCLWQKRSARHRHAVDFLRYNLEAASGLVAHRLMVILDIKFAPGQLSRLENHRHLIVSDDAL